MSLWLLFGSYSAAYRGWLMYPNRPTFTLFYMLYTPLHPYLKILPWAKFAISLPAKYDNRTWEHVVSEGNQGSGVFLCESGNI